MAEKILWQSALTQLSTTDLDGIGNIRKFESGIAYKYVKNSSTTALTRRAPCEYKSAVTGSMSRTRVIPPLAANHWALSGIPVTAIGKSGSTTGAFGFVQIAGPFEDAICVEKTALAVGGCMVSTAGTGNVRAFCYGTVPAAAPVYANHVRLLEAATATTPATTFRVNVLICCLAEV
jgi:hypothetical protein